MCRHARFPSGYRAKKGANSGTSNAQAYVVTNWAAKLRNPLGNMPARLPCSTKRQESAASTVATISERGRIVFQDIDGNRLTCAPAASDALWDGAARFCDER